MKLYKKVYIVHTGYCLGGEGDSSNYSAHKAIATSADAAIEKVKGDFADGEYAESVELVIVLD